MVVNTRWLGLRDDQIESVSARLGPDKGTARKRDDGLTWLQFHTRLSTRLTHQTALSRSLADRSAVTTLDIELACDTLNSVAFDAFDGHGPVKIDTRSMWTAFWNFCLVSRFCAAHCDIHRILLGLDSTAEHWRTIGAYCLSRGDWENLFEFLLPPIRHRPWPTSIPASFLCPKVGLSSKCRFESTFWPCSIHTSIIATQR